MRVLYGSCCGLDVHKRTVAACVRLASDSGPAVYYRRTFGTMTEDLRQLADWLRNHGVTHVGMESTGVYWKPVYNMLEGSFVLTLANAKRVKNVPGRKTDVSDAQWLADLLAHGLLEGSCVPERSERELQELVRYRRSMIRQRASEVNRLQKVLEGANVKLASVVTDITGVTGRAIVEALIEGRLPADRMAELAKGRLRSKQRELASSVEGQLGAHQRFMLRQLLEHIDYLEATVAQLNQEIDERLRPFAADLDRLQTAPGIGRRNAQAILAELPDLSRFPTAGHLASWAGLAPGNNESAGKRRSAGITDGNHNLRETLVEAAWVAVRRKHTYAAALYRRLVGRRGAKRAIVAVAHHLLISIYHMMLRGEEYHDLGETHFDLRHRERTMHRLVKRIEDIGYTVTIQPVAEVA